MSQWALSRKLTETLPSDHRLALRKASGDVSAFDFVFGLCCRRKSQLSPEREKSEFILEPNLSDHGPGRKELGYPKFPCGSSFNKFYISRTKEVTNHGDLKIHSCKLQRGSHSKMREIAPIGSRGYLIIFSALGLMEAHGLLRQWIPKDSTHVFKFKAKSTKALGVWECIGLSFFVSSLAMLGFQHRKCGQ